LPRLCLAHWLHDFFNVAVFSLLTIRAFLTCVLCGSSGSSGSGNRKQKGGQKGEQKGKQKGKANKGSRCSSRLKVVCGESVLLNFGMPDSDGSIALPDWLNALLNDLFGCESMWRCVAVLGDGHCLFRAAGKHLRMQPGEVRKMVVDFWTKQQGDAAKVKGGGAICVVAKAWSDKSYREERVATCEKWTHVAEDKKNSCNQKAWGGTCELKLLAIDNGINVVVFDVRSEASSNQAITIYTPSLSEDGGCIYPNMQADMLESLQDLHQEKTLYLVFNGVHYNPILFAGSVRGELCSGSWSEIQVTGGKGHTVPTKRQRR
jgi:hypothetical protein